MYAPGQSLTTAHYAVARASAPVASPRWPVRTGPTRSLTLNVLEEETYCRRPLQAAELVVTEVIRVTFYIRVQAFVRPPTANTMLQYTMHAATHATFP